MLTGQRGRQAREFRRVIRVEEAVGPPGGRQLVLYLECEHVLERP
jgi:hypothetical protein